MLTDFEKFAVSQGLSSNKVNEYGKYATKNLFVDPTIIEERERHVAAMSVSSALFMNRILTLSGEINEDVGTIISCQLLYLESVNNESDVTIYIASPGGSVSAGLGIYDTMNFIKPDVSTICLSMCASMGAVLLSSGKKGKRYALPNSSIMIHQPLGGANGQCSDILIAAEEIKKCKNNLYGILSRNTGRTFEEIERDSDRDKWFTSTEALEYGLVDKVLTKRE